MWFDQYRDEGCDVCDAPCKAELNEWMSGIAIEEKLNQFLNNTQCRFLLMVLIKTGKLSFDGLGRYAIENDNDIVTIYWASSLFSTFPPWLLNKTQRNSLCP